MSVFFFTMLIDMGENNERRKTTIRETDEQGREIGQVTVEKNRKGLGHFIRNLFVGEEHRGKGVGSKLVDKAIEKAGGTVLLEVEKSNLIAVQIYKLKGFVVVEEVEAKNGKVYLRMEKN